MTTDSLDLTLQRELPSAMEGCEHAYGRIVGACQNTVTAIALAMTRDVHASEDIAQEAFLKAWQQLARLHNPSSFLPWLRQITRNLARDWLRANRHRALTGEGAEIAIGLAADPAPSPAERLLRREEEIAASEIISALPAESRETLLLYYREGQRSQQVAELLGLSDAAVRKRLSRARATVRSDLLQRFGDFARGSAPSAAFTSAIVSAALIAAPSGTSAAILIGSGVGGAGAGKLGAGGLGASALSGGTAAGSLSALASHLHLLPTAAWISLLVGLLGGGVASYLGGLYLLHYADTRVERDTIKRFVFWSTLTAAALSLGVLALALAGVDKLAQVSVLVLGVMCVNYQFLVQLPRAMGPMLARDAARRGRSRPSWLYQGLYGRPAILIMNLSMAWVVANTLYRHLAH